MSEEVHQLDQTAEATYEMLVDYLAGDRRDEEQIYGRLRQRALLIARARLRAWLRQRETSEDIAQEAVATLWGCLEKATFDHPGKLAAYLSVVVQHVITGRARYHGIEVRNPAYLKPVERSRDHLTTDAFRIQLETDETTPIAQLVGAEDAERTREAVAECLAELPEHYREVVIHRVICNLPNREAAHLMGREADGAFSMLSSRARARLASLLAARGFGAP